MSLCNYLDTIQQSTTGVQVLERLRIQAYITLRPYENLKAESIRNRCEGERITIIANGWLYSQLNFSSSCSDALRKTKLTFRHWCQNCDNRWTEMRKEACLYIFPALYQITAKINQLQLYILSEAIRKTFKLVVTYPELSQLFATIQWIAQIWDLIVGYRELCKGRTLVKSLSQTGNAIAFQYHSVELPTVSQTWKTSDKPVSNKFVMMNNRLVRINNNFITIWQISNFSTSFAMHDHEK